MTLLGLVIIVSTIILPIMASDAHLEKRVVPWRTLTLSTPTATTTPTTGQGQVGTATHQPGSASPLVGTPQAVTQSSGGMVGTPLAGTASSGGMVGTPQAGTASSGGMVGVPLKQSPQSFFDKHTINSNLPNYAVLLIIVLCLLVFFSVGAFFVYRFYQRRQLDAKRKNLNDEEDIMAAYSRFWKKKQRNSGGASGFVDVTENQACTVHVEEKVQRRV